MTLVLAYYVGGMRTMTKKILIACEYSGVVREAFAKKGWDAWSCDLLPTDQPSDKHIQGDCLEAIANEKWDMIIAHPPCTHLSLSGAKYWAEKRADGRQQAAINSLRIYGMQIALAYVLRIQLEH